jgi:hypothetical protein
MFDSALELGAALSINATLAATPTTGINLQHSDAGSGPAKQLFVNLRTIKDITAATLSDFQFTLETADDSAFASPIVLGVSDAIPFTAGSPSLKAGALLWSFPIPPGVAKSRIRITGEKTAANYPHATAASSVHVVIDAHPAVPIGLRTPISAAS